MKHRYTIAKTVPSDAIGLREMQLQSWLDTYPNDEHGVTTQWIKKYFAPRLTDAGIKDFEKMLATEQNNPNVIILTARDSDGMIVGYLLGNIDDDDKKYHLSVLYTDKKTHGSGLGSELMQRFLDWSDLTQSTYLDVVVYNKRAMRFYEKWGYRKIPHSEYMENDILPSIKMVRKGDRE
jgi:RimJ/RimL family protein N-acetyltransferase